MSEHSSDSISNRLAQPEKNTSQKKHITRLIGHNNTDQPCDRKSLLTDSPESWSHKEPLYNRSRLINHGDKIIPVIYIYKELHILPRPLKALAQWKFQHITQKEVHLLSRPSKLQPVADYSIITQCTQGEGPGPTPTAEHLRSSGDVPRHT